MQLRVIAKLTAILLLIGWEASAQSFIDNALLFSRTRPGGSARIQSMGGAQIALGGDFSSALSNPAGLGMYNRSEATVSPAYAFHSTEATYNGNTESDSKNVFNMAGLSYVHHSPQTGGSFLGGSFGISMTRTNDFNSRMRYSGSDNVSSIVDFFLESANGTLNEDLNYDLPTGLAYNTYLIDDSTFWGGPEANYFSIIGLYDDPNDIRNLERQGSTDIKGAQYQWSLAYGANFSDKVFAGLSVGITTLKYKFSSTYRESDFFFELDPDFNPLNYLELQETIDIEGSGVNLTLGLIYRPVDFIQIGMSYVTPTAYQVTDTYSARMNTLWNNYDYLDTGLILNTVNDESLEPLIAEYNFTSPMKFSIGTAVFLGSKGFISGDVEFVNYSKAKYKSDIGGISFDFDNQVIGQLYTNTVNYRLGGEFRHESFRVRAGYNVLANPYDNAIDLDRTISTWSLGLGFRSNSFFVDVAWLSSQGDSAYLPYSFQDRLGPVVDLNNQTNNLILTVGLTF